MVAETVLGLPRLSGPSVPRLMRVTQHVLFAVLVGVGLATGLADTTAAGWLIGGTAALIAWYGAGVVLAARHRTPHAAHLWLAGLLAIWAVLIVASTQFVWVAFALFFLVLFLMPPSASVPAVVVITAGAVASLAGHGANPQVAEVVGPVLGAAIATAMALIYRALLRESERRQRLVEELVAAQDDLVVTHDALARVQRETGVLHERERLARDIHDTLAQGFSSIVLHARVAREHVAAGGPGCDSIDHIEQTAVHNLDAARRLVRELSPSELDGAPLLEALQRLVARLGEQAGLSASCATQGEPYPTPTSHEVALLRVAQSALANVRQHARARHVAVTISYLPDAVALDIVDDGVGFDAGSVEAAALGGTGFGLRAMRSRVADLGGELVIETAHGEGTAVAVSLPRTVV